MITERKQFMSYTYFNPSPDNQIRTTHLFSSVKRSIPFMVRVPFPTMTIDLKEEDILSHWASSARTKVHRAVRELLTVDRGQYLLPHILKLFSSTAKKRDLKGYVPEDFTQFPLIRCSAVSVDGVMLCGHVWVLDEASGKALLYVSASNYRDEHEDASLTGRAHYFLLWQDGLVLKGEGMLKLDLMGYKETTDDKSLQGVYQWKAATHGQQEMLYHYYPFWFYVLRKFRNMVAG